MSAFRSFSRVFCKIRIPRKSFNFSISFSLHTFIIKPLFRYDETFQAMYIFEAELINYHLKKLYKNTNLHSSSISAIFECRIHIWWFWSNSKFIGYLLTVSRSSVWMYWNLMKVTFGLCSSDSVIFRHVTWCFSNNCLNKISFIDRYFFQVYRIQIPKCFRNNNITYMRKILDYYSNSLQIPAFSSSKTEKRLFRYL